MEVYPNSTADHTVALVPENIAEKLKRRRQWIAWAYREREGKPTKIPYSPCNGRRASATDLMTWGTFEEAMGAFERGKYAGIGFVFCSADPFVGVDLDKCRAPETGTIEKWAQEILESFEDAVHVDVSPSGTGVHLITKGVLKEGINTKRIEVYGQDRFFTVTGVAL